MCIMCELVNVNQYVCVRIYELSYVIIIIHTSNSFTSLSSTTFYSKKLFLLYHGQGITCDVVPRCCCAVYCLSKIAIGRNYRRPGIDVPTSYELSAASTVGELGRHLKYVNVIYIASDKSILNFGVDVDRTSIA